MHTHQLYSKAMVLTRPHKTQCGLALTNVLDLDDSLLHSATDSVVRS